MPPISLQVTQEFVDGNTAALQAMMTALTYHPASKLAFYVAKLGQHVVYVKLSESAAGTAISIFFGAAAAGLLDLKAGDILTFDGKGNVTKTSASGSSSGGSGSGSGSGSGGSSGGGTITIPGGNGGTVIFACTGTKERLVCKPIIV